MEKVTCVSEVLMIVFKTVYHSSSFVSHSKKSNIYWYIFAEIEILNRPISFVK